MLTDRIEADYLLETPIDPRRAAETMAGEQSSGTFVAVPGETPELKERSAARVIALDDPGRGGAAALAALRRGRGTASASRRARVTLSWPLGDARPVPAEPRRDRRRQPVRARARSAACRLLDIRMPPAFAEAYPGPRFGIEGTRRLAGVEGRPLIGTIIKPSVGLDAEATAALVEELCEAGIDFIKDDELQSDGPNCPFDERVRAVMRVIEAAGRPHRQEGHVRLQPHRRPRPDAPAPRHAARPRRHLPDGEPELGRARRHDRARPLQRASDPRASQRLGLPVAPSAARLVLRRVAEALAARRRRPHARQRPAQQVLGAGRERHRVGARLPRRRCSTASPAP